MQESSVSNLIIDNKDIKNSPSKNLFVNYEEFNWKKFLNEEETKRVLIEGSTKSGKTTLFGYLWPILEQVTDLRIIFCGNPQAKGYKFLKKKDKDLVFIKYDNNMLAEIKKLQHLTENKFLKILIYFDDLSSKKGQKFSNEFIDLWLTARNKKIFLFFSTQSPLYITKESRNNIDLIVIFYNKSQETLRLLAEKFLYHSLPREWFQGLN